MNMCLTGFKKIINNVSYLRGAKESSTPRNGNNIPKHVISCTILRNYLDILNPLPVNLGVHITRSACIALIVVKPGPNDSSISGYSHTTSKPILGLPICGGEFLYLLPCSIYPYDEDPLLKPMSSSWGDLIMAVSRDRATTYPN